MQNTSQEYRESFECFGDFKEFINELIILLKKDYEEFKKFLKEQKQLIIFIIMAFISLQFTNVLDICQSFEKYYKKRSLNMQGGANATPLVAPSLPPGPAAGAPAAGNAITAEKKKASGLFAKLKGKVRGVGMPGAGPILGNIGIITNAISGALVLIGVILAIAGAISLPFLIYLIIVYTVIKVIAGTFTGL